MHTPSILEHDFDSADHSGNEALVAAHRMIELAEKAIADLSSTRELNGRETHQFLSEIRALRSALHRLAENPADLAAAARMDKLLPLVDHAISARLWALSPPVAAEWRACHEVVFKNPTYSRHDRGHLGRTPLRALGHLREWARSMV